VRVTPAMAILDLFEICNPAQEDIIQSYPDLVFNGENYVVVWSDEKYGEYYVTAGRVSPTGAVLDTGTCISTGAGSYEYQPRIAYDGSRCLAVWPKSSYYIQGRFVNSAGLPEDTVFNIAQNGSGPALACDGTNYLVAWFTGTYPALDIKARMISWSGVPLGSEITVTTDSDCNRWPDVIFDGNQYVVVWTKGANSPSSQYVWAQAISAAGTMINGNFQVSANTAGQRWFPAIASSDSNYLITWGQTGTTSDIYGNADQELLMIHEENSRRANNAEPPGPTIRCGSLNAFIDSGCLVFDISGRKLMTGSAKPGIYFIADRTGKKIIRKIIKVR